MTAVCCPGPFKPPFSFCLPAAEMDPDAEGHWVSCWAWSRLGEAPDPGVSRSPTSGSPCWGVASRGRVTARARDLCKKLWKKKLKTRNYFFFRQLEKKNKAKPNTVLSSDLIAIPHSARKGEPGPGVTSPSTLSSVADGRTGTPKRIPAWSLQSASLSWSDILPRRPPHPVRATHGSSRKPRPARTQGSLP